MTRPSKLSDSEVLARLNALPAWKFQAGKLHRGFAFKDFSAAFGFMTSAALIAERMDHHPEWSNVWNTVTIDLTTHDAQGVTSLDVDLATRMEDLATRFPMKAG